VVIASWVSVGTRYAFGLSTVRRLKDELSMTPHRCLLCHSQARFFLHLPRYHQKTLKCHVVSFIFSAKAMRTRRIPCPIHWIRRSICRLEATCTVRTRRLLPQPFVSWVEF
jgi:hypothetical protein